MTAYGKVGSDFSTILDSARIRASKRLFTTATPRTYSTSVKKAAGERDIEVVGMDDEAVFGKVLYSLPFGKAIKRGLLTDYQVVIIGVDNPTIAQWIQNRELIKTDSGIENDAEALAAQIGLLKALKDYDLQRVISFHNRVSRAESFIHELQQVAQWIGEEHRPTGSLKSDFVSGAMPTDKRRRKLAQLRAIGPSERGILANARCLSEGVDVPSLDGVAFIDPRSSQIDIVQAVGRAIRLSPNKKTGTIVLPVFIEDGDTPIESIEASNFKPIWDVLNALKAHDDVLSAEMDQLRTDMGRKSGSKVGVFSNILVDLPSSVDQSFGASLRTHLVERVTESWEGWYGLLQAYVDQNGDAKVPQQLKLPDGRSLGSWVSTQRGKEDTLPALRKAKLESLSGWSWNPHEEQWDLGFQHLKEYSVKHGDCLVPAETEMRNGYSLGGWVSTQRATKERLSLDRKKLLESLPGWSWKPYLDQWEKGHSNLKQYVAGNGDCLVPIDHTLVDGFKLGRWVSKQRLAYAKLSPQRKAILESLKGWSWNPHNEAWEVGFRKAEEFIAINGHCRVPATFKTANGYPLGQWVRVQRTTRGTLATERLDKLGKLMGWSWDPLEHRWMEGFKQLEPYLLAHGDCFVPSNFVTDSGFKLGNWISNLRSRRDLVRPEYQAKLEALPNWTWDSLDDLWNKGYSRLKKFVNESGNCSIPEKYTLADGYGLGAWTGVQRRSKDSLSEERKAKLESLEGWHWAIHQPNVVSKQWDKGFEELRKFATATGDCAVAGTYKLEDGFKLGLWVKTQRRNEGRLTNEQRNKLESLRNWSWNRTADRWELGFRHLEEYLREHDNCLVPFDFVNSSGFKLGTWVSYQRGNQSRLSIDRVGRLEKMDKWKWAVLEHNWDAGFSCLAQYVVRNGTSAVPQSYCLEDGYPLGTWLNAQRQKRAKLSPKRIALLESLPDWSWTPRSNSWETGYLQLEAYTEKNGNCLVPAKYKLPSGYKLGMWLSTQRLNPTRLSPEQRLRLEALEGWTWDVLDGLWERGFSCLEEYALAHENCLVHFAFVSPDGFRLGSWVAHQRNDKAKLSPQKKDRLEALSMWVWNVLEHQWSIAFARLKDFAAEVGHSRVPQSMALTDGFRLGSWVSNQRTAKKKGRLTDGKIQALELLPGWKW